MINSVITIGGHLVNRTLCDESGNEKTLPELYPYLYQFKLRLVDIGDDGNTKIVEPGPNTFLVTALSASIGLVYAEPRAGTFKLRYGTDDPSTEIDFREDAEEFRTKLSAITGISTSSDYSLGEVYQPTLSTWVIRYNSPVLPDPIPLEGVANELDPETFIRVRQFFQGGEYWVEVRLMRGPVASTSAHETILADPPIIQEIRSGFTQFLEGGLETIVVNEIQALSVPPGFSGTYILKFEGRQTRPLSAFDSASTIAAALNGMFGETPPIIRFSVTNPEANRAYIEFIGPLGGIDWANLDVIVSSEGNSSLFFNLDLKTAEVEEVLRTSASVDMSFEVTLHIADPHVPNDPGQDLVLFQAPVTIIRPLQWEGLLAAQPINWLFPPNPVDYVPFDLSQVITGHQSYQTSFGDGLATQYVIIHNLNADSIDVAIRQNVSPGLLLRDNEYVVTFTNTNSLTITMPTAPATNSLLLMLVSHGDISAYAAHTHSVNQIIGLQAILDELLIRVSALEQYFATIPSPPPGGTLPFGGQGSTDILNVAVPEIWNVAPTNRPPGKDNPKNDVNKLPTAGLMLPAVHDAIQLGEFTADPGTDLITLDTPSVTMVEGQRIRIDPPVFYDLGTCAFNEPGTNTIFATAHGLIDNRQVRFHGGILPTSIVPTFTYFVINHHTDDFQISSTLDGPLLPLSGNTTGTHFFSTISEPPGGLDSAVDYFISTPTGSPTSTFKLSATLGAGTAAGPVIDITDVGFPPITMSSIEDAPAIEVLTNRLPPPGLPQYIGRAFSVREQVQLNGGRGIRAAVAYPGDIVASDGRIWYQVTRSDSPGKNSFYPSRMEQEIFRIAINDRMLAAQSVFTLTWDMTIRMFKQTTDAQYLMVCEWADLSSTLVPDPTGPNLYAIEWHKVPILSQKLIITEVPITNHFGIQVVRLPTGQLKTNKKAYSVQVSGDSVPTTANFALRCRLIEWDTEDNVKDAVGLVYYSLEKCGGQVTLSTPEALPEVIV